MVLMWISEKSFQPGWGVAFKTILYRDCESSLVTFMKFWEGGNDNEIQQV